MRKYISLIRYEWKLMKHAWFAQIMVFIMGVYWGLFQNNSMSNEFSNFVSIQNEAQMKFVESDFLGVLINILGNSIITCLLVAFSGLLFGVFSILLVTMQGIYTGFFVYAIINGMYGTPIWYEYIIVSGFEIISIFLILCAGAIGLYGGKLVIRGFWNVFRRRETILQAEIRIWWAMLKHNFIVIIFLIVFLAIGKAGMTLMIN